MTTPRPGSRVIRSLYSFLPNRALVQARASFWGVQGVPGISPGHPFGPPGAHPRSAGRLEGLLGAPGSSRGALWGALGSPGGPIWGSSPPCRRLFLATICYTFTASAPEGIFAAPEGHAILSIFATLAALGLLTRHPRIPAGTRSCAYLLHILHVGPRRNFSRRTKVCDLAAICDTCGTWPSHTPLTDSRGHPILCIFTTHSTLPLGASPSSNFAPFESYAYLLHFPSAKALGSVWG